MSGRCFFLSLVSLYATCLLVFWVHYFFFSRNCVRGSTSSHDELMGLSSSSEQNVLGECGEEHRKLCHCAVISCCCSGGIYRQKKKKYPQSKKVLLIALVITALVPSSEYYNFEFCGTPLRGRRDLYCCKLFNRSRNVRFCRLKGDIEREPELVWTCLLIIICPGKDHLARHCEGSKTKGKTQDSGGKTTSCQGEDRTGLSRVTEDCGRQTETEAAGYEIISGAPTTVWVKELIN